MIRQHPLREFLPQLRHWEIDKLHAPYSRQLLIAGPDLLRGCAEQLEDLVQLINLRFAREERLHHQQLTEDASNTPDIDVRAISLGAQQELGSAIPKCDDYRGVVLQRAAIFTCQTKVAHLEDSVVAEEEIACFQVSVQDPIVVEMMYCPEELLHQTLHLSRQKHLILLPHCLHQSLQVMLNKVHHDENLVHVRSNHDLPDSHHIDMLRNEQSVDFPE